MGPKASQVLDDILARYLLELDLLKVAKQAILQSAFAVLSKTSFIGRSKTAAEADVRLLRDRLDEMTVVEIWIEFERFIVRHVFGTVTIASAAAPISFTTKLSDRIEREIEFARFDELLDLYKGWLDPNHVGLIKQIKDYRDWISHRNPKKTKPAVIEPITAHKLLSTAMDALS